MCRIAAPGQAHRDLVTCRVVFDRVADEVVQHFIQPQRSPQNRHMLIFNFTQVVLCNSGTSPAALFFVLFALRTTMHR